MELDFVCVSRAQTDGPTTSGLLLFAGHGDDGRWTTLYETHGGGEGARADRDGAPVVRVHMSNVMNTPAEVIEAEYPVMTFEGNMGDEREFDAAGTKARMDTFMETLGLRREKAIA